jgi:hypothetical protein
VQQCRAHIGSLPFVSADTAVPLVFWRSLQCDTPIALATPKYTVGSRTVAQDHTVNRMTHAALLL